MRKLKKQLRLAGLAGWLFWKEKQIPGEIMDLYKDVDDGDGDFKTLSRIESEAMQDKQKRYKDDVRRFYNILYKVWHDENVLQDYCLHTVSRMLQELEFLHDVLEKKYKDVDF
jgi:hypothetical protein